MEETVMMTNDSAPATVFAFAPEDVSPVDGGIAEPMGEEASVSEATVEAEQPTEVDAPHSEQADIGKAFSAERKRIEAKFARQMETDPMRILGKMMVDDLIETKGLSQEEAVKMATDNFLTAVSKRDNLPNHVVRRLMQQTEAKEATSHEDTVKEIISKLDAATKPHGFDEATAYADEEFQEMLLEMPVDKAIRLYHAEHFAADRAKQDLAEKMRARQAIPQTINPQQPASPVTDWSKVDSDAFFAEKERRQKFR